MSKFLSFNTDSTEYTTDEGKPCTFVEHLFYLNKYGGSPDNFNAFDELSEAVEDSNSQSFGAVVVDSLDYEIVHYNER